jgi:hypothetical protein
MKSMIIKTLGTIGVAAGILGLGGSAQALKSVPIPATYNVFGTPVTDANPANPTGDYVTAAGAKTNFPADAAHVDVTANIGGYQTALSLDCSTGSTGQNKFGTNTTDGDVHLACPGSGGVVLSTSYGAINYQ